MKYPYIFLLGRPGCGKSAVYREVIPLLKEAGQGEDFIRLDDFPKLWNIFQTDEKTGAWKRCRKTPDGGYKVTDNTVWDDILKELNADLLTTSPEKVIFVEFARDKYCKALKNFSEEVLKQSLIVYIQCSFDTCWKRNVARHEAAVASGTDDHLVSREEMEKTYLNDDIDKFKPFMEEKNIPLLIIDNEAEGDTLLKKQVDELFNNLLP